MTALGVAGGRVTGVTAGGDWIAADWVVNAGGPHAAAVGRMAGVDLPVHPVRMHQFVTAPVAGLTPGRPVLVEPATTLFAAQEGEGMLLGMRQRDATGEHVDVDWDFLPDVLRTAAHRIPKLHGVAVETAWAGLVEMSPDHVGIVGAVPEVAGFLCANGLSGHGFMLAPAVGRIAAALMLDGDVPGLRSRTAEPAAVPRRMTGRLGGRHALVTGGGRGIGRAISLALAAEGADVAVAFRTDRNRAEETVAAIQATGRRALAVQADCTDPASAEAMVGTVTAAWGRLDLLVNNAGERGRSALLDLDPADWDRVVTVNLRGVFLAATAAARAMRAEGGAIVNIAGASAHRSYPWAGAYGPSKAAVVSLTKQMALEWAEFGIRVNGVKPRADPRTRHRLGGGGTGAGKASRPHPAPAGSARRRTWPPPSSTWPLPTPPTSPGTCCWWTAAAPKPGTSRRDGRPPTLKESARWATRSCGAGRRTWNASGSTRTRSSATG